MELRNVLVFGGIKDRDGFDRTQAGNLVLFPEAPINGTAPSSPQCMAFQTNGFFADTFVNNTCVTSTGLVYESCGSFGPPAAMNRSVAEQAAQAAAVVQAVPRSDDGYPNAGPVIANNTFVTPTIVAAAGVAAGATPFSNGGCGGHAYTSLEGWQAAGFDRGTTQSDQATVGGLVEMSRQLLRLDCNADGV
jgi:hypothetical protein